MPNSSFEGSTVYATRPCVGRHQQERHVSTLMAAPTAVCSLGICVCSRSCGRGVVRSSARKTTGQQSCSACSGREALCLNKAYMRDAVASRDRRAAERGRRPRHEQLNATYCHPTSQRARGASRGRAVAPLSSLERFSRRRRTAGHRRFARATFASGTAPAITHTPTFFFFIVWSIESLLSSSFALLPRRAHAHTHAEVFAAAP